MIRNEDFLKHITYDGDSEIEKGIKSGDAYTICDLLEQTKGGIYLRDLENAIVATDDIVQIYEFLFLAADMKIPGFNQPRFEKLVRESGNPKLMCYSMAFVPGTDLPAMIASLEETRCAKYMEMIMKDEEYDEVFEEVKKIDSEYEIKVEKTKNFDWFPVSLKEFEEFKNSVPELKEQVKGTQNPHLITELANYLQYLNEYQEQSYEIDDLTAIQEELQDPMQAYEYLASVKVEKKTGLIQAVVKSGRTKFMYYVYEYVPGLTEEEKDYLNENIKDKKYKAMLGEEKSEKEEGRGGIDN